MAARQKKTPAQCVGSIITAAMSAQSMTAEELAERSQVHRNTVYRDLKDPDRMQASRMWTYFVVLGVPVDDALQVFAASFARSLVMR